MEFAENKRVGGAGFPLASLHMDFLRGICAWAVVAGHLRYFFFPDFESLVEPGLAVKLLYSLSAFGHEAVVFFFVLSGFWIASSAFHKPAAEFSLLHFGIQRASRLYVVLIPCLLFSFLLDWIGMHSLRTALFYSQRQEHFFGIAVAEQIQWTNFWGTLAFVQSVKTGIFGSNAALWSLAYEFWYYVTFGLLVVVGFSRRIAFRIAAILLLLLSQSFMMNGRVLMMFPLWCLGSFVYFLLGRCRTKWKSRFALPCAVLAFLGILGLRPYSQQFGEVPWDWTVAVLASLFLLSINLASTAVVSNGYAKLSRILASFSFSLYAIHVPLLLFLRALLFPEGKPELGPTSFALAVALFLFTLGTAWIFYLGTERHTPWVRAKIDLLLRRSS